MSGSAFIICYDAKYLDLSPAYGSAFMMCYEAQQSLLCMCYLIGFSDCHVYRAFGNARLSISVHLVWAQVVARSHTISNQFTILKRITCGKLMPAEALGRKTDGVASMM